MARYLYSEVSSLIESRKKCLDRLANPTSGQIENAQGWADKYEAKLREIIDTYMPSGSGFDNGTKIDLDRSHADKLVFMTAFHHMENGYYSGWTEHEVTVTPSLSRGFNLRVSGRNVNDIKEHVFERFHECLESDVEWEVVKDWAAAKAHAVEIKSDWVKSPDGQDRLRYYVVADGAEVYDSNEDPNNYYQPLERCRHKAVEIVKNLYYSGQ